MRATILFCSLVLAGSVSAVWANKVNPTEAEIEDIIKRFAGKEAEFAKARERYTYRQTVSVREFDGSSGAAGGNFELLSDIVFTADGKRTERIVKAPVPTLKMVQLTPEDEQDLRSVQPFVLTSRDIDLYHVRYLGNETLDEIPCYAFAVKPKKMEPGKRYFQGIVWVDQDELQIVKSYGRGTGVRKKGFDQKFPKFETYREQIDGKFWFPTFTTANDTLHFEDSAVRLRMTVRYEEYKQFGADIKITFGDAVASDGKPAAAEPTPPAAAPATNEPPAAATEPPAAKPQVYTNEKPKKPKKR
ncbi:MAG: outer membrane lipoprotein-sorting protein [Acidobacteria bacterium]|nr:outer membrane lipoprotein-sorting protein [Acidobacteriota bacterium]